MNNVAHRKFTEQLSPDIVPPPTADPTAPVTLTSISNIVNSQVSSQTSKIFERMKKIEELLAARVEGTQAHEMPSQHHRHAVTIVSRSSHEAQTVNITEHLDVSTPRKRKPKRRKKSTHKKTQNRRNNSKSNKSDNSQSATFVQQLLQATGLSVKKKKGKKDFLPHLYVIKNDKTGQVQSGNSMWYEHLSGIFRMLDDPALPQHWIPNIRKHL